MPHFSAERKDLVAALCAVMATVEDPTKDRKVDAGAKRYKYATLESFWPEIRAQLATGGILATGGAEFDPTSGRWVYVVELSHAGSGQWVRSMFPFNSPDSWKDPQALASEHSYAHRYCVLDILELVPSSEDDDARAAKAVADGRRPNRTQEAPAAKEMRQAGHHDSWEGDKKDFMANLGRLKVDYDDLCLVLESKGEAAPSARDNLGRTSIIQKLKGMKDTSNIASAAAGLRSVKAAAAEATS